MSVGPSVARVRRRRARRLRLVRGGLAADPGRGGAVTGLPEALDGVRIGHLSDFHLGARLSRGNGAIAARGRMGRRAKTGPRLRDRRSRLASPGRGAPARAPRHARRAFVVLGNHDVAVTRDPFSRAAELRDLEHAVLLRDGARRVELRGEHVSRRRRRSGDATGPSTPRRTSSSTRRPTFRLLLCHFPGIVGRMPAGVVRPDPRRPPPCRPDQRAPRGAGASPSPIRGRGTSQASTRRRPASCTSRPEPGRPSSPSDSSRGPR